jgi:hypothetical protein
MRLKFMTAVLGLATALSMQAQQATPRIDLTFTAEQQGLAQQLRAMQAEFELDQSKKEKLDSDLRRLLAEREVWIGKVEAAHPGYKVANDDKGFYLSPATVPSASVPSPQK